MLVHEEIAGLIGEYAALNERTSAVVGELGTGHSEFVDYLSTMLIYELTLLRALSASTPPAPPERAAPQRSRRRARADNRQRPVRGPVNIGGGRARH